MDEASRKSRRRSLQAGVRLGPYEVTRFVGAGGMAEIYAARDTRLDREVAIKVLPSLYGTDRDRLRRFEQEARATSRLSHPNIVSVFDAGHEGSTPYIVTELLEGETLRRRMESGPLDVREAIAFAVQIARGLSAAHEKGIVHRDLKPANLFVTSNDHLKILDFGLAKLTHPEWEQVETEDETVSVVSRPGAIVGSVGYMSPEQVEGEKVDHRSDIFSVGTILYEMLTGERPFRGASTVETMHKILKEPPPPLHQVRPDIDESLVRIVSRCLAKKPENRFQSARDLGFSLEELTSHSGTSSSSPTLERIRAGSSWIRSRPRLALTMATIVLAALVGASMFGVVSARPPGERDQNTRSERPARFNLERVSPGGDFGSVIALSPDGRYLAHDVDRGDGELRLTHIPTGSTTLLSSARPIVWARFSPDGNYIYYLGDSGEGTVNLYRIPMLGGDEQVIALDIYPASFTFSPDGGQVAFVRRLDGESTIIIADSNGLGERVLSRAEADSAFLSCAWSPEGTPIVCSVSLEGGESKSMVEVDVGSGRHRLRADLLFLLNPEWTPDGTALVGTEQVDTTFQVWRVDYPTGRAERLTSDLSDYFYPTIAADGRTIAAVRIDTTTNLWGMRVGDPSSLRQITRGMNTYDGNFGIRTTPDDRIVWASGISGRSIDLWICDRDGSNRKRLTFDDEAGEKWPDLSPDGRTVVYIRELKSRRPYVSGQLWRVNVDGTLPLPLPGTEDARNPKFTADGERIIFARKADGAIYLFETPAEGGEVRQLDPRPASSPSPSPDGKWLLVGVSGKIELWSLTGDGKIRSLPFGGLARRWRPDGRAFALIRPGAGGMNIWLYDLETENLEPLTQLPDGEIVAWGFDWSRDGEEIVFARRSQSRDAALLRSVQ